MKFKYKNKMMPELNSNILLSVVMFYLLINMLPWGWIYQFTVYQNFVDFMSYLVPSIKLLPGEARHGGYEYSVAQLSMLHFFGIIFVFYIIYRTKKANNPMPKIYKKKGVLLNGIVSSFGLGLFFVVFFHYWQGTFNYSVKDGFHDVEWKMTLMYVVFWYLLAAMFGLTSFFLKTLISHKNYQYK